MDVIKTVQALMLVIDFTTPLWVKNLILQLSHIKHMEKHFELLSNNLNPKTKIEVKEIKEQMNEIALRKEDNNVNEFDESSEKSQKEEKAQVNYKTDLINTPSEEVMLNSEVVQAAIPIFHLLLMQLCGVSNEDQSDVCHGDEQSNSKHSNTSLNCGNESRDISYSINKDCNVSPIGENYQHTVDVF